MREVQEYDDVDPLYAKTLLNRSRLEQAAALAPGGGINGDSRSLGADCACTSCGAGGTDHGNGRCLGLQEVSRRNAGSNLVHAGCSSLTLTALETLCTHPSMYSTAEAHL
jgi:hypothetical protein